MKKLNKIRRHMLLLILLFLTLPCITYAAENIDLSRDVKLNISYQDGDTALSDAEFKIYLVATADKNAELTVTETFKQFNVDIRGKNDVAWKSLASTLEGYVLRDNIAATDSGKSDGNGKLSFPTGSKKLTQGLYLVLCQRHTQGSHYYDASPFMLMLPAQDLDNNKWNYEISVDPKYDAGKIPNTSSTITRKVLKVWNDAGKENLRPQEIVVQLLRDGDIYDTVTLNASNNWRYTWTGLDERYTWMLTEKKIENYTVSVMREGITFVVTNTHSPSDSSSEPETDTVTHTVTENIQELPQTGALWWPVPLLVVGGLAFLIVGMRSRKKKDDE